MKEDREGLPPHLRGSSVVLEVRYGDVFETHNHTTPLLLGEVLFNFVPPIAYLWMLPPPSSSLRDLREARRLWPTLRQFFSPTLMAHAKNTRDERFLRFFGFHPYTHYDGVTYFKESDK